MKRLILLLLVVLLLADPLSFWIVPPRNDRTFRDAASLDPHLPKALRRIAESRIVQAAASVELRFQQKQTVLDPLELVPENALLLLDAANAAACGQAFFSSGLGQAVAAADWQAILNRLRVKEEFRRPLEQRVSRLMRLAALPLLREVLSRRIVLTLLPPAELLPQDELRQVLTEHLALIVQAGQQDSRLLALLSPRRQLLFHHGMPIQAVDLQAGGKLYAAAVGGQLILSFGLAPVQQSIDLFLSHFVSKRTGLALNREYAELKRAAQGRDDLFVYADLRQLHSLLVPPEEGGAASVGFQSLSLFHQQGKEEHPLLTAVVRLQKDQLSPAQQAVCAAAPTENRTLRLMPAGLLVYFWTNWMLPEIWQQSSSEDESAASGRAAAWLKKQTGKSINDILALFGREFSVIITEISTAGFFPVPKLCLAAAVQDQDQAGKVLKKMLAGLPIKQNKVAGTPVVSLMAANGLMQPSYAFADNVLLMADSKEQLADILDAGSARLAQDPAFQAVGSGMLRPSNLSLFVRISQLVDGLKEVASWAGTMIAVRDEEAGQKSKVLVDQVISPLLDGLRMYEAVGLRGFARPGELVFEATVLRNQAWKAEEEGQQAPARP